MSSHSVGMQHPQPHHSYAEAVSEAWSSVMVELVLDIAWQLKTRQSLIRLSDVEEIIYRGSSLFPFYPSQ